MLAKHLSRLVCWACLLVLLTETQCSTQKRGVGWNFEDCEELQAVKGITWFYNWGTLPNKTVVQCAQQLGVEFVPMQWGQWGIDSLPHNLPSGAKVLLGFNEPNHKEQSNLTPQQAASFWFQVQEKIKGLNLRIGSPAPAPCGANCVIASPFDWWDQFFAACKGCKFDFLATHLYDCNPNNLRSYLDQCKKYNLPIWLTEFDCPNGNGPLSREIDYMQQALQILDSDPAVERYAWFTLRTSGSWLGSTPSLLDAHSSALTQLGTIYVGRSEFTNTTQWS